jgi:hypothetical protein
MTSKVVVAVLALLAVVVSGAALDCDPLTEVVSPDGSFCAPHACLAHTGCGACQAAASASASCAWCGTDAVSICLSAADPSAARRACAFYNGTAVLAPDSCPGEEALPCAALAMTADPLACMLRRDPYAPSENNTATCQVCARNTTETPGDDNTVVFGRSRVYCGGNMTCEAGPASDHAAELEPCGRDADCDAVAPAVFAAWAQSSPLRKVRCRPAFGCVKCIYG